MGQGLAGAILGEALQDDAANDVALCDREVPGGGTQGVYEALMGNENRETVFLWVCIFM